MCEIARHEGRSDQQTVGPSCLSCQDKRKAGVNFPGDTFCRTWVLTTPSLSRLWEGRTGSQRSIAAGGVRFAPVEVGLGLPVRLPALDQPEAFSGTATPEIERFSHASAILCRRSPESPKS